MSGFARSMYRIVFHFVNTNNYLLLHLKTHKNTKRKHKNTVVFFLVDKERLCLWLLQLIHLVQTKEKCNKICEQLKYS